MQVVFRDGGPADSKTTPPSWFQQIQEMLDEPSVAEIKAATLNRQEPYLRDDLTIVTGFINIGEFQKGGAAYYTPAKYYGWMSVFEFIKNPLVVFVENDGDRNLFLSMRASLPANLTRVHVIKREELWSYVTLLPNTTRLFAKPEYPKHPPNTVIPEYSCIMHAKYEMMLRTALENPFGTRHLAWLDIGLFRDMVSKNKTFELYLPPSFDPDKVAYEQVYNRNDESAKSIFYGNHVWVCGCFYLSRVSVMVKWTLAYMKYARYFLQRDLMNTDQQVIYAMFNVAEQRIQIQEYHGKSGYNPWFSLGYVCKEEGEKRNKQRELNRS